MNNNKKMLNVAELIPYLKEKNIKFNITNETAAEIFLKQSNNYFNITSYKRNFEVATSGFSKGKYLDLDFAYLQDLGVIDYRLRLILFDMIINIEHYLKIKILNDIESIDGEDGYRIVNMYLDRDYNSEKYPKKLHNSIFNKIGNEHYKNLFNKYDLNKDKKLENIPIWEFLEIITYGELVSFYDFFGKEYKDKFAIKNISILRDIGKLRNAVAHNTCILSNVGVKDNGYSPDSKIIKFLSDCNIEKKRRDYKLSNSRIRQITYTLYMFNIVVTSTGIKKNVSENINKLMFNRIILNKKYYNNNGLLKSVYIYFANIITKYYKID